MTDERIEPPLTGGERETLVMLHLIQEYARHYGHADLIREGIDGRTGVQRVAGPGRSAHEALSCGIMAASSARGPTPSPEEQHADRHPDRRR